MQGKAHAIGGPTPAEAFQWGALHSAQHHPCIDRAGRRHGQSPEQKIGRRLVRVPSQQGGKGKQKREVRSKASKTGHPKRQVICQTKTSPQPALVLFLTFYLPNGPPFAVLWSPSCSNKSSRAACDAHAIPFAARHQPIFREAGLVEFQMGIGPCYIPNLRIFNFNRFLLTGYVSNLSFSLTFTQQIPPNWVCVL